MQFGLGCADVGTLLDQLGRQRDGQFVRQLQFGEIEEHARLLARETAGESKDLVLGLGQLLLQERQLGAHLRDGRLLGQHIGFGDAAEFELLAQEIELLRLGAEDRLRGLDLRAQRSVLHGGDEVLIESPGGGGYGDAHARDPERLARDLYEGFVSPAAAQALYGASAEVAT